MEKRKAAGRKRGQQRKRKVAGERGMQCLGGEGGRKMKKKERKRVQMPQKNLGSLQNVCLQRVRDRVLETLVFRKPENFGHERG